MLSQSEMNIKAACMKMKRDLHKRRRAENIANIQKKKDKKLQELYCVFARYCKRKGTDCSKGVQQYWDICSPSERLVAIEYQREFEQKQEEENYKVFVRYIKAQDPSLDDPGQHDLFWYAYSVDKRM
jgi:hypothetical protein